MLLMLINKLTKEMTHVLQILLKYRVFQKSGNQHKEKKTPKIVSISFVINSFKFWMDAGST